LAARPFTRPAQLGGGVSAVIDQVRSVQTITHVPGEVGGPSIAVTVTLTNHSSHAISVGDVVVEAVDGAGTPAVPVTAAPTKAFRGSIAPGKSRQAIYAFSMAKDRRNSISVTVSYAAGTPVARFVGNAK
jgi:hypothetical protein